MIEQWGKSKNNVSADTILLPIIYSNIYYNIQATDVASTGSDTGGYDYNVGIEPQPTANSFRMSMMKDSARYTLWRTLGY